MADTGLKSPTVSVSGGQWTNPDNVFTSNNVRARETTNGHSQQWRTFGFGVPAGATILGIQVSIEGLYEDTNTIDVDLSWNAGANWTSPVKNASGFDYSETTVSVGGSADTWNRTWSDSDFSDANFRCRLTKQGQADVWIDVDHLQVQVWYTPDLALHFEFEDGSGATVTDSSGNNNDGTITGTQGWTTGKCDDGLDFDYTDGEDYVTVPNSATLENVQEGDYTLAAWFNPGSTPPGTGSDADANYGILIKTGWHLGLYCGNDGKFHFDHVLSDNSSIGATSTTTFSPGTFYHVAGVLDKAAGTVKIYVDGDLEDTANFTPGAAAREYGTMTWKVGVANPGGGAWGWAADGTVDDLRIYGRTLDGTEINALVDLCGGWSGGNINTVSNQGSVNGILLTSINSVNTV